MVTLSPEIETSEDETAIDRQRLPSEESRISMLPVPATTFSPKVSTMLAEAFTAVASSAGLSETRAGATVSTVTVSAVDTALVSVPRVACAVKLWTPFPRAV